MTATHAPSSSDIDVIHPRVVVGFAAKTSVGRLMPSHCRRSAFQEVSMADNPRQVRDLREDIAHANAMLRHARNRLEHDDCGTANARQLIHWYERREMLLARITAQPEE